MHKSCVDAKLSLVFFLLLCTLMHIFAKNTQGQMLQLISTMQYNIFKPV